MFSSSFSLSLSLPHPALCNIDRGIALWLCTVHRPLFSLSEKKRGGNLDLFPFAGRRVSTRCSTKGQRFSSSSSGQDTATLPLFLPASLGISIYIRQIKTWGLRVVLHWTRGSLRWFPRLNCAQKQSVFI